MQIPPIDKIYLRLVAVEQETAILRLKVVELSKPKKKEKKPKK